MQELEPENNWLDPGPGIGPSSWQFMQNLQGTMTQPEQPQPASAPVAMVTLAQATTDTSRLVQIRWGTREPIRLPSARVRAYGTLVCVADLQHADEPGEPLHSQLRESCVLALQEALARQPQSAAPDSERAARVAADMSTDLAARCADMGLALQSLAIEGMVWEQEADGGSAGGTGQTPGAAELDPPPNRTTRADP
jgi:hypothetical protein